MVPPPCPSDLDIKKKLPKGEECSRKIEIKGVSYQSGTGGDILYEYWTGLSVADVPMFYARYTIKTLEAVDKSTSYPNLRICSEIGRTEVTYDVKEKDTATGEMKVVKTLPRYYGWREQVMLVANLDKGKFDTHVRTLDKDYPHEKDAEELKVITDIEATNAKAKSSAKKVKVKPADKELAEDKKLQMYNWFCS